jgi:uncharacterized protein YdeI (YjbR/CyaY-like superfamily)
VDFLDLPDAAAWTDWLETRHGSEPRAWLRIRKRHSDLAAPTIEQALDVALCYGWIDGHRKSHDDASFLQRYSPRRPRTAWSRVNVAKVEALTAAGRMRPAGLAQVREAQADGRWAAAYEPQATATTPEDLQEALARERQASVAFARLTRSARYALVLPLLKARTPQARARLVTKTVQQLAFGLIDSS